jgi:hypothetical protein
VTCSGEAAARLRARAAELLLRECVLGDIDTACERIARIAAGSEGEDPRLDAALVTAIRLAFQTRTRGRAFWELVRAGLRQKTLRASLCLAIATMVHESNLLQCLRMLEPIDTKDIPVELWTSMVVAADRAAERAYMSGAGNPFVPRRLLDMAPEMLDRPSELSRVVESMPKVDASRLVGALCAAGDYSASLVEALWPHIGADARAILAEAVLVDVSTYCPDCRAFHDDEKMFLETGEESWRRVSKYLSTHDAACLKLAFEIATNTSERRALLGAYIETDDSPERYADAIVLAAESRMRDDARKLRTALIARFSGQAEPLARAWLRLLERAPR